MKIFVVLSLVFMMHATASVYSQNTKITLSFENAKLDDVLSQIEKETEFVFFYRHGAIDNTIKVNVHAKNENIYDVLKEVFRGTGIDYSVKDRLIILGQKEVSETLSLQQGITITGIVTDADGVTMPGANITVKGTTTGVVTDVNGKYTINVPNRDAVLVFSFIGYAPQEFPVGNQTTINISMAEDSQQIEEVVVVGYGTIKKTSLTGSVTDIKAEEIAATPTTNLSNLLAGRAPGVTIVNNSGFVGAGSSIRIRGKGTWNNQNALFVIDNVVQDSQSQFDALDPNEVESISFLKDAATTAIYGSRASNGVVLVKTKTGFYNRKPSMTYTGSFTISRPTRSLQEYSALDELTWLSDQAETWGNPNPVTQAERDYFVGKEYDYQLLDYLWQNPWAQQHNISVGGGSDKITYFTSVGLNKSVGTFKNTEYDRYNFRSNVSAKINDYISINVNIGGNQQNSDRFYWPYDNWNSMTIGDFYRATFNWSRLYPYYVDANGSPLTDRNTPGALPVSSGGWHPIELVLGNGYRHTKWRTLTGTGRVEVKIPGVEGLKASVQYNYTAGDYNTKSFILHNKSYQFQRKSTDNKYIPGPIDPTKMNIHNLSSSYENINEMLDLSSGYQIQYVLNYDRKFGEHNVSAVGLYEAQESSYKYVSGQANKLLTPSVDQIFNTSSDAGMRTISGYEGEYGRAAWAGRLHYEYSTRYILEFSFRYDGSDRFPKDKRWGFFPSGSFAWRISEEGFFNVPVISSLKLRGSVGTAGDDMVTRFQYQNSYSTSGSYVFGDNLYNGIAPGAPPNKNITWEKAMTYDVGVDFGLFEGLLTGEIGYYYQKRWDILRPRIRVIPTTYGVSNLRDENYAKVDNWGYELALNFKNNIGEVTYSIGANMGFSNNKIVYIDEAAGLESWRSTIGHPIDYIWGYQSSGVVRDQATVDALNAKGFKQFGRAPMLGVLLYDDIRGENRSEGADNKIDSNDETYLSRRAIPRINYGVNLSAQWRGFFVDALFQGVGGYDRMISTINGGGVFQVERPYFALWTDHWSPSTPNAKYPRAGGWYEEFGATSSSFWMRNGAYCRLKNLNIGYSFPKKWISHVKMEALKVYLNGTNLFDISGKWSEMDPEQSSLDSFPIMRSFTAGLSVTF